MGESSKIHFEVMGAVEQALFALLDMINIHKITSQQFVDKNYGHQFDAICCSFFMIPEYSRDLCRRPMPNSWLKLESHQAISRTTRQMRSW